MKNILITGGAGKIGISLIAKLVDDTKYNITVLDLKSTKAIKALKPYRDKIEVVYGDINNQTIMRKLIRKNDLVFHLASVTPPTANTHHELCDYINLLGTEHICDIIHSVNDYCHLVYISSTIKKDLKCISDDYTKTNIKIEDYIKKNVNNYTIVRLQPVLIPRKNIWINAGLNDEIQFINMESTINLLNDILKRNMKYLNRIIIGHGDNSFITTYSKHVINLKAISRFKYHHLNNDYGYSTEVINKNEAYQTGSLNDFYKACGKK